MSRARCPFGARALGGVIAILLCALTAGGCKDQESLVIVEISAVAGDPAAASITAVTVAVGTTSRTFDIKSGVGIPASAPQAFGVYLGSDVTGTPSVTVTGKTAAGCIGETGTTTTPRITTGSTVEVPITVMPPTAGGCPPLSACTELDHEAAGTCAKCTAGDAATDHGIYGVAFSPKNPQLVVTGAGDGSIKVWTVSANRTLTAEGHVLPGSGTGVVAFSPDGSTLAVGRLGSVDLVDVSTWTTTTSIVVPGDTYGVGFTADGQRLVALGYDSDTYLGTLAAFTLSGALSGTAISTKQITDAYALAVSPVITGGLTPVAVTTSDGDMQVFQLGASGFSAPSTVTVTSDGSYAETAAFSPQGDLLASGGDDAALRFWSLPITADAAADADPIDLFANTARSTEVWSAAFSPDQTQIAVGGGGYSAGTGSGSLTLWNVAAPRSLVAGEYDTAAGYDVVSVAYAPSGNLIVAGESDCGCVLVCPL